MGGANESKLSEKPPHYEDAPPSYEEAQAFQAPLDEAGFPPSDIADRARSRDLLSRVRRILAAPKTESHDKAPKYWQPTEQLQFITPDPKRIRCRCGRRVDTTRQQEGLEPGSVRCKCGYIVESTGYSSPACSRIARETTGECRSRGTHFRHRSSQEIPGPATSSAQRVPEQHWKSLHHPKKVPCKCGRYVDTTITWTLQHGRNSSKSTSERSTSLVGYTMYSYALPAGSGRCVWWEDGAERWNGHVQALQ